ncbi:MAG: hypothetical protein MZV65_25175 [Chromatiales bacterium]|nr:hypothetical protein [Chromatiales bacterium]
MPHHLRGTFAGLAHPEIVKHLQSLGITAVELMPVHAFVDDRFLDRPRAAQLLGLQHPVLFRTRTALPEQRRSWPSSRP